MEDYVNVEKIDQITKADVDALINSNTDTDDMFAMGFDELVKSVDNPADVSNRLAAVLAHISVYMLHHLYDFFMLIGDFNPITYTDIKTVLQQAPIMLADKQIVFTLYMLGPDKYAITVSNINSESEYLVIKPRYVPVVKQFIANQFMIITTSDADKLEKSLRTKKTFYAEHFAVNVYRYAISNRYVIASDIVPRTPIYSYAGDINSQDIHKKLSLFFNRNFASPQLTDAIKTAKNHNITKSDTSTQYDYLSYDSLKKTLYSLLSKQNWYHDIINQKDKQIQNLTTVLSQMRAKRNSDDDQKRLNSLKQRISNINVDLCQSKDRIVELENKLNTQDRAFNATIYAYETKIGSLLGEYHELEDNYDTLDAENQKLTTKISQLKSQVKSYRRYYDLGLDREMKLRFDNNMINFEKYDGTMGVYLILGKDDHDDKPIFKIGRARNLNKREILYSKTTTSNNNHFSTEYNPILVNFLSIKDLGITDFDTAQYYALEAFFRNYFQYRMSYKYRNEWFDAQGDKNKQIIVDAFMYVKNHLKMHPDVFEILDEKSRKSTASSVAYVREHFLELLEGKKENFSRKKKVTTSTQK